MPRKSNSRSAAADEPLLLRGLEAIGKPLGTNARETRTLISRGLPAFKLPGSNVAVARPSSLRAWLENEEAKALAARNEGAEA